MTETTKKAESKRLPIIQGSYNFKAKYVLGAEGPVAKDLKGFQVRNAQIVLAEQIQEAFKTSKHLIAEAQTGTGKSYAALLGAFETSIRTRTPVIISTYTIALQEQLCQKDVPFLLDRLNLKIRVSLAKGRGNYVSIRRANIAIKEKQKGYRKLANWLSDTDDGTKSSLTFKPDYLTWSRARSDADQCLGENCPTFKECFYQKSRRNLGEAHVIITNHNLVLLDLKMKSMGQKGVLPEYKYLVLDEAHEVENVARQTFTFELRQKELQSVIYEIWNTDKSNGFLNQMVTESNKLLLASKVSGEVDIKSKIVKEAAKAIEKVFDENEEFFKKVKSYVGSDYLKRFTEKNVIKTTLVDDIGAMLGCLKSLNSHATDKNNKAALDYAAKRCTEIAMGVDQIITLPNVPGKKYPEVVAWAGSRMLPNKTRAYSVTCSPIFLKPLMRRMVFKPLDSVVLMSATLSTGGKNPFRMFESILGVPDPMRLRLASVFDYKEQAFVVLVTDMPEQKKDNYADEIAKQVKKYVKATSGGAFVLFTSFKVMNKVYEDIKVSLEVAGYKLFCQGKDLNRNQMISEFKKTTKGVLLGVSSFWTGVDIPGRALSKLIITKLPFPSPVDPLMQAQAEIYEKYGRNFFMERSIPMTAIMLKQGFGRLIRTNTDKGMVVILDSRVVTKKYGSMILSALPSKCPQIKVQRNTSLS